MLSDRKLEPLLQFWRVVFQGRRRLDTSIPLSVFPGVLIYASHRLTADRGGDNLTGAGPCEADKRHFRILEIERGVETVLRPLMLVQSDTGGGETHLIDADRSNCFVTSRYAVNVHMRGRDLSHVVVQRLYEVLRNSRFIADFRWELNLGLPVSFLAVEAKNLRFLSFGSDNHQQQAILLQQVVDYYRPIPLGESHNRKGAHAKYRRQLRPTFVEHLGTSFGCSFRSRHRAERASRIHRRRDEDHGPAGLARRLGRLRFWAIVAGVGVALPLCPRERQH